MCAYHHQRNEVLLPYIVLQFSQRCGVLYIIFCTMLHYYNIACREVKVEDVIFHLTDHKSVHHEPLLTFTCLFKGTHIHTLLINCLLVRQKENSHHHTRLFSESLSTSTTQRAFSLSVSLSLLSFYLHL